MTNDSRQTTNVIEKPNIKRKQASNGGLTDSSPCVARLIEFSCRVPATAVESLVVTLLKEAKEVPCKKLVWWVADNLYRNELRAGAWAIDIGLFGSGLFVADALDAVNSGNGELWEIVRL